MRRSPGFGIEHRPGYQQLLAAALSSPAAFEIVLVEDLSRLTRDMAELLRITTRLRLKGVEVVGVSDGIATGQPGAKMHVAVKGLVNELYLDDLRDKTHRGLSGAVARGLNAGGRLYGMRRGIDRMVGRNPSSGIPSGSEKVMLFA
jgi:site-specific DNA recombinase